MVIVGAGLGGTATAIRLLRFAREPIEVVLAERRSDYRYAGAAYHREGNPWQHIFNIQAGRMSAFREDVDDFVDWANLEADRRDWPSEWSGFRFVESGPAPRRIYPDYLSDRLAKAAEEACPGVELIEFDGEVIDVQPHKGFAEVIFRGESPSLRANHVVLATGLELGVPAFASEVLTHEAFVREPYSRAGISRLLAVAPEGTVVIVGSVLSAYDAAGLLLRRGHTGKIYLVSGSGSTLRSYPDDHQHGVIDLPPPSLKGDLYEGREEFLSRVRAEWEAACFRVRQQHPNMHSSIVTERVAKAWEPYIPEILERIPSSELRSLLAEFATVIATLRVGALTYTTRVVEEAMQRSVDLIVGRVSEIAEGEHGRLAVTIAGEGAAQTISADLVISNFGRQPDYEKVDSELWRNLLRKGIATPHERTGRGLEVSEDGILLDSRGQATNPIWTIGVLREGDEFVRNGRTGAFSFNLAAIKNHSVSVAVGILEQLEAFDTAIIEYQSLVDSLSEKGAALLAEAVDLEVGRMAARSRRDRENLEKQLESCLQAISAERGELAELRRAVSREAVKRMTNLSVTPRQLRHMLGLTAGAG